MNCFALYSKSKVLCLDDALHVTAGRATNACHNNEGRYRKVEMTMVVMRMTLPNACGVAIYVQSSAEPAPFLITRAARKCWHSSSLSYFTYFFPFFLCRIVFISSIAAHYRLMFCTRPHCSDAD
ncbi:unnamed protein product [Effrenium voratum]|nr:unnamed protein product [Effrenium voratum]